MARIGTIVTASIFAIACMLLVAAAPSAAETLWVSSEGAKLKAERGATAASVAELPLGMELIRLGYEKRWYRVKIPDGREGWIYRGKVSETPPAEETAAQEDSLGSLLGGLTGSSIQADTADTSRSIRGLSPEAKEYARQKGTPETYQQALDEVLALKTDSAEIEDFLEEGRIGEYAE